LFTGLVQEVGRVLATTRLRGNLRLTIEAENIAAEVDLGSSVCVNGVCLTAVRPGRRFEVEVGRETLDRTNLSQLRAGSRVNLENPVKPTSLFGGHFVTGHVDATARIKSIKRQTGSEVWEIETPEAVRNYIVEKGSVCVEGASLTVASVNPESFTVSLLPHTLESTTLCEKHPHDLVNIEADILAKHIEKLLYSQKENRAR
jgi:riboflavin synthase